ncbi:MAG: site-specific DNA-methyltransferase, partial [Raineya sp.]|nr:site-specific DNA-methyltransferase [Raineya sp.]
DVFILFGGSGSEIMLCRELKRNFISCEIHPEYYEMIFNRLKNNGKIAEKYRLEFLQEKRIMKNSEYNLSLFNLESE